MKNGLIKKFFAIILAIMLILTSSLALADTVITVTGSGETQVSADTAIVSLGVNARDKDVLAAQQKVNGAIAAIRQTLVMLGVPEDCINTDYMNIYAVYDYQDDHEQVQAYNAGSTLAIKITNMENVGKVIDSAFAAGANTLNSISFSASDTEAAKAESLKKAVSDAKAKAEVLAEAAGLKLTEIETISEGGVFSYDNSVGNFTARGIAKEEAVDTGTVVQAAKLIVSASITLTFRAE
jgi:hypothetical protein